MLRLIPLICSLIWLIPHELADEKNKGKEGQFAVEVADGLSLEDRERPRKLSVKVYYPKTGGPFPVIVFSHGFGADKDAFGPIGKHWASHGYVVIHPSHDDGIGRTRGGAASELDESANGGRRSGLTAKLNNPTIISGRVEDLVLVLDRLEELPKLNPGLSGKLDLKTIGIAGHSFGAYTTMLIGGVTVDLGGEKGKSFLDKRVKCILPISAQGTGQQGLTEKSYDALKLPMLTITGTRDRGVGGQAVDWRMEPFRYSPKGDKYLVVIEGAGHVSFGGGLRGRDDGVTEVVKLCSTHFWDAYLKDSASAKNYLQSGDLVKDVAGKCRLEKK